jgi:hypothetical protein
MRIDPGMHIVMHLVFFGKTCVTLLRPKTEVEWRAAAGEEFLSEDVKEQIVFGSFFERGFNLPEGDFFRGLL